jgi:biopolymer transport protein TolR
MAFSRAGGGPSHPQISVTPLIDVLLVLIIVFMVVVSISKKKGLEAQIPQPAQDGSQSSQIDRTLVIQVVWGVRGQPPGLKINQDNVSWADLPQPPTRHLQGESRAVAFVQGTTTLIFSTWRR